MSPKHTYHLGWFGGVLPAPARNFGVNYRILPTLEIPRVSKTSEMLAMLTV